MEINDLNSYGFPRAFVYILIPTSICAIFVSDENKNMLSMTELNFGLVQADLKKYILKTYNTTEVSLLLPSRKMITSFLY